MNTKPQAIAAILTSASPRSILCKGTIGQHKGTLAMVNPSSPVAVPAGQVILGKRGF